MNSYCNAISSKLDAMKSRAVNRLKHATCVVSQKQYLSTLALLKNDARLQKLVNKWDVNAIMSSSTYRMYLGFNDTRVLKSGRFYCETIMHEIAHPRVSGLSILRYLGGGAYGKAFLVEHVMNRTRYVLKVTRENAQKEVAMQRAFNAVGLAPRVHFMYTTRNGVWVIIMEPAEYTLQELLCLTGANLKKVNFIADSVVFLLAKMHMARLIHGDMHDENIMFARSASTGTFFPVLIDLGFAKSGLNSIVDAEKLITILYNFKYPLVSIFTSKLQHFLDTVGHHRGYRLKGTSRAYQMTLHSNRLSTYDPEHAMQIILSVKGSSPQQTVAKKPKKTKKKARCKPGWARHSVTGRCRLRRNLKTKKKARCKPGWARHSVTRRCRLRRNLLRGGAHPARIVNRQLALNPFKDARGNFVDPNNLQDCPNVNRQGWKINPNTRRCFNPDARRRLRTSFTNIDDVSMFNDQTKRHVYRFAKRRKLKPCPVGKKRHKDTLRCRKAENVGYLDEYRPIRDNNFNEYKVSELEERMGMANLGAGEVGMGMEPANGAAQDNGGAQDNGDLDLDGDFNLFAQLNGDADLGAGEVGMGMEPANGAAQDNGDLDLNDNLDNLFAQNQGAGEVDLFANLDGDAESGDLDLNDLLDQLAA